MEEVEGEETLERTYSDFFSSFFKTENFSFFEVQTLPSLSLGHLSPNP